MPSFYSKPLLQSRRFLRKPKRFFNTIFIIPFILMVLLIMYLYSSTDIFALYPINNRNITQCDVVVQVPSTSGTINDYFLPKGYIPNSPLYFNDLTQNDVLFQADVYNFAAYFASHQTPSTLIDVGSGTAYKSSHIYNNVTAINNFVVLDFGPNLDVARSNFNKTERYQKQQHVDDVQFHEWDIDQHSFPSAIQNDLIRNATIVVADVIEHLINPDALIDKLVAVLKGCKAKNIIISTPNREAHLDWKTKGPPTNPHHIREWSLDELKIYLQSRGAPVTECISTWTKNRARKKRHRKTTSTCLISQDDTLRFPDVENIQDYFPFTGLDIIRKRRHLKTNKR